MGEGCKLIDSHIIKPKSLKLNFALNTTRTVLNFLVPVIIFPYVSRILGPDGLGKVDFANSIVSYFALFTALGIPVYGMREIARVRDDEKLRSQTVCELAVILAITVCAGYLLYIVLINFVPQMENQKKLFLIVAPTIFLSSFSFDWFYQGIEDQTYITVRYIIVKLTQIVCIFLLVKSRGHFLRYAAIAVGMSGVSTFFNITHLRRFVHLVPVKELDITRHIKLILIVFASLVAVSIYMHLDVTMLGFFCSDANVGFYTAANRLVRIVIMLVTALSAVIVPRLENCLERGDNASYLRYLNLSLHYILLLALPCCFGVIALAPDIITIFAGEKYFESIKTIRLLSPIVIIVGLANFVGLQILYPHRQEWKYTFSVTVAAIVNACFNAILIPKFAQNGAAIGTLIAEGLGFLFQVIFAWRYLLETDFFSFNTVKYIVAGIGMYVVLSVIPNDGRNLLVHCVMCVLIAALVYGVILIVCREKLLLDSLKRFFFRRKTISL